MVDLEWLRQNLPIEEYGRNGKKSFEQLHEEIAVGETVIREENGRPLREVRVVQFETHCRGQILIEDRQIFANGDERRRSFGAPSEKLLPSETYEDAVRRGLCQELGLSSETVERLPITYLREETKVAESGSYPGLTTRYALRIYRVDLPDELYQPEYVERSDSGMTSYFKWQPEAIV